MHFWPENHTMQLTRFVSKERGTLQVSDFMIYTLENLLIIFELLMAYLCDIHAQPFAGDKRVVVEVSPAKRLPNEKHVRFKYDILWTK